MEDFVEAKFAYLARFEEFKCMSYLTTQFLVHENFIRVFFSNVSLKQVGEPDEDSCRIVAINTYVMVVSIWVTQEDVATAFDMQDNGYSDEHERFLVSMLIPNDNASNLQLHERLLHLFISHFFDPHQIDYSFMHHVQAGNQINLPTLIFQDLIKVV